MNRIIRLLRSIIHDIVVLITPKFLRKNMLSCEEVSFVLASEQKITVLKRIKLKAHLMICQNCTDYTHQLEIIKKECKKINSPQLSKEQNQQINNVQDKLIERYKQK